MTKKEIIKKFENQIANLRYEFDQLYAITKRNTSDIENKRQFTDKMLGGIFEYLDIKSEEVDVIQNINGDKKIVTLYKMVKNEPKTKSHKAK